jgi:hypothetical protein
MELDEACALLEDDGFLLETAGEIQADNYPG